MASQSDIIDVIKPYLNSGLSITKIAEATGINYHALYRIMKGQRKNGPRADAGRSREGIYEQLIPRVREEYLQQGKLKNLQYCIERVYDEAVREYPNISRASLRRHVDAAAKAEKWQVLWTYRKNKPGFNLHLPKLHYDRTEWPFMGFFVMDNRTSDTRVYSERLGRIIKPYMYYIYEACTGRILGLAVREESFRRIDVARLIVQVIAQYGRPLIAFICDNGSEQIGGKSIQLMECFWPWEYVEACHTRGAVPELHTLFDEALSPVVTSIPRIPTFPMKAALERTFANEGRHFDAFVAGHLYAGTGRGDQVATSLVRSPRLDGTALTFDEYARFCQWRYTAPHDDRTYGIPYLGEYHPDALRLFAKQTGCEPTIGDAWIHYAADFVPCFPPPENLLQMFVHTETHYRKRVTSLGQVRFQHNREWYSFSHPGIGYELSGEYVDVILDPSDDTRALIMHRGTVLGIADDLDRRRRDGRITMAEARYLQRMNRNTVRSEIKAVSESLPAQRKPAVPTCELPDLTTSPFELGGVTYGEFMEELTNKRLDETTEPQIEIDDDIKALSAKYLHRSNTSI